MVIAHRDDNAQATQEGEKETPLPVGDAGLEPATSAL